VNPSASTGRSRRKKRMVTGSPSSPQDRQATTHHIPGIEPPGAENPLRIETPPSPAGSTVRAPAPPGERPAGRRAETLAPAPSRNTPPEARGGCHHGTMRRLGRWPRRPEEPRRPQSRKPRSPACSPVPQARQAPREGRTEKAPHPFLRRDAKRGVGIAHRAPRERASLASSMTESGAVHTDQRGRALSVR
jgi:hypothetical protein